MEKEKAVAQLVFLFIFLGTPLALIVIGTKLNMYLFSRGVLGSSRYNRVHPIGSFATTAESPSVEQRFYTSLGDEQDQSSRYARNGMMFIGVVLFVVITSAVFLLVAPH
ncbi:MAG TPA: hypothetical protein VKH37_11275 [Ferruginibacter sp.]|jgi:hypothetical protein|nr:hypothetical protein [Ferruginibacter sp.]